MTEPQVQYTVPADITEVFGFLQMMMLDISDVMAEEVREWRSDLRGAIHSWKQGGDEPDWQAFRESMNEICRDDGSPKLFEEGGLCS